MTDKVAASSTPIIIKKYANRRLYNTATSGYVTLDHLCRMVKDGVDFVVHDAKSGEDITHFVLTQIIVEEESKGNSLLPISFLKKLIALYDDNMQWLVPRYLEYAMESFSQNQDRMRDYFKNTLDGILPIVGAQAESVNDSPSLDEMRRRLDELQRQLSSMAQNGQRS